MSVAVTAIIDSSGNPLTQFTGRDYYLRDFQRDFTKDRQSVARLADVNRVPDRLYDIYDRYAAYDRLTYVHFPYANAVFRKNT